MISIRTSLLAGGLGAFGFAVAVLDHIGEHVLVSGGDPGLKRQLEFFRRLIRPGWSAGEAVEAQERPARLLEAHREAARRSGLRQGIEWRHILAMPNQALTGLAGGRTRSVARLHRIQESLRKTSLLQDLPALKCALAGTVKFVQQEAEREPAEAAAESTGVRTEGSRAKERLGRTGAGMAGRAGAAARIADSLRTAGPDGRLHRVASGFDRIRAEAKRHGAQVVEEIFSRLIREGLQPAAPGASLYRWTAGSLAELRAEAERLNRAPLVRRAAPGDRTAVLTRHPSQRVAGGRAADGWCRM